MVYSSLRTALLRSTILVGAAVAAFPAIAQTAPATTAAADKPADIADTVVTGSIIRSKDVTASPVTTLSVENLDRRAINTVQSALQQLSANNGPSLTNSFSANGAFAGGASSISLRGLSTNSTLVLFDGLRAAYYPLADDGQRNFVDLNTIPDDIVDRIEVLRDGASSSYGADAIAGVVNIITKREFKGVAGRVEGGVSGGGFAGNQRFSLTVGTGDLAKQGFNVYLSGFYFHSDEVRNADLPYPFNSDNLSRIGNSTIGFGPNNVVNGPDATGAINGFGQATDFFVRPYTNVGFSNGVQNGGVQQGRYQKLNPASACLSGQSITQTAAQLALAANASAPAGVICQEDFTNLYGIVSPQLERIGGSGRFTATIGENSEAYAEINFSQNTSSYSGDPATIRGNAPTGILSPRFSTSTAFNASLAPGSGILALPVYICPRATVGDCNAINGTLNPNNPFAAQNQVARILGRFPQKVFTATRDRVYRAAIGIKGTIFDDLDYGVDATAMHSDLEVTRKGYVFIQNLLNVVKDGSYNFVNPGQNSAAINSYLAPTSVQNDASDLYQLQATLGKSIATLPGGPLAVAVGASVYYEGVNSPSGNPDYNGPTQRYFTLNAFGTVGHRTVASAFGEIKAPIFDQLELGAAGRYDHYSSGQSNFSPKGSAIFRPFKQLTLRGTYSRGFRIPAFAEANALPTTGYVTQQASAIPNAFLAQYGAGCTQKTTAGCPAYLTAYSIGLTTLASPNLKPEKSRSFTGGIKFDPIRNVTFTVDYYNITKTGVITTPSSAPAQAAYYANTAIPAGYNVIADAADVNNPTARPRIAFIESQLINANKQKSSGIDFGANVFHDFGKFKFTSTLDASLLLELSTTFPDGTKETYVDTLGNFNLTAGSGTFRWKGNWANTVEAGPVAVTGTVNYTSGYDLSAMDQGDAYRDHGQAPGYTGIRVKSYITADLNASFNVKEQFTFYVNVINLFGRLPGIDPVTYGAHLYNPVQGGDGIYGRQFRAGAKFKF